MFSHIFPENSLSIAEVFEIFEVGDIDFLGDALPRDFRRVGVGECHAIDSDEHKIAINEILHEGDGKTVALALQLVVVGIAAGNDFGRHVGVAIAVGERGQKFGRIAFVAPLGMVVFAAEEDDVGVVGNGHRVGHFAVGDAEELEIVVVSGEFLSDAQDVGVVGLWLGGCAVSGEPINGRSSH